MDAACIVVSPVGKPQKIQNTEQEDVPTKERGFEVMLKEEKKYNVIGECLPGRVAEHVGTQRLS